MSLQASGRRLELRAGRLTARVTEVGAALRGVGAEGAPPVHTHADHDYARFGERQLLIPWPNRVAGGAYEHAGRREQLPIGEPGVRQRPPRLPRQSGGQTTGIDAYDSEGTP